MTYQQPIAPPTNALALAGLVLGVIAALCGLLAPNLMTAILLPALPGLLAIIFGFIGINTAHRLGGKRRRLAVWAIVLGFAPIPLYIALGFFVSK